MRVKLADIDPELRVAAVMGRMLMRPSAGPTGLKGDESAGGDYLVSCNVICCQSGAIPSVPSSFWTATR